MGTLLTGSLLCSVCFILLVLFIAASITTAILVNIKYPITILPTKHYLGLHFTWLYSVILHTTVYLCLSPSLSQTPGFHHKQDGEAKPLRHNHKKRHLRK